MMCHEELDIEDIVGHRMNTASLARAAQLGKAGVEEEFRPREAN